MQKTGTTSLQISLGSAREKLAQAGLLYPSGTLGLGLEPSNAHHFLAHAMLGRAYAHTPKADLALVDQHCASLCEAAAAFDGDTLLSSEDLSRISPEAIVRLRNLLPADTRVVIYLRRQDYWIDSLYGQALKFDSTLDLTTFLTKNTQRMNYAALLDAWSASFGAENIVPRVYERRARRNLWADFCVAIGRPKDVELLPHIRRDNVSLTRQQIALLDAAPDPISRRGLRRQLEQFNRKRQQPTLLRHIPADCAADLLAAQADNNAAVAQRYLKRDQLFFDQAPASLDLGETEDLSPLHDILAKAPAAPLSPDDNQALHAAIKDCLQRLANSQP